MYLQSTRTCATGDADLKQRAQKLDGAARSDLTIFPELSTTMQELQAPPVSDSCNASTGIRATREETEVFDLTAASSSKIEDETGDSKAATFRM